MQKKQTQPTKQVAAIVAKTTKLDVEVNMTPSTVTMTYGEVARSFSVLGFIGSVLKPNSFKVNVKLRACRRALQDHADDLDDMTQKLMLDLATRKDGEVERDDKGNFSVKQPEFDIERRNYLRTTIEVTAPVWCSNELEWMQDVRVEGMDEGFIFRVLEDLGPLYVPDEE